MWVLQHVQCETLGIIAPTLESMGVSARYIRTFEGQPVPKGMDDTAGLIVMGGPMGVYEQDHYAFLRQEVYLIERALKEEKPVLGICLGSQLLAAALGATVTKGEKKEIGWHPVTLTESARTDLPWRGVGPSFMACHWHGDIFGMPPGGVSLAFSDLTACQGFRYGRNAYGFSFHIEIAQNIVRDMVMSFTDELQQEGIDGSDIVTKSGDYLPRLQEIGGTVFRRWAGLLKRRD